MDELTEFPGSCSGTSACKVSRVDCVLWSQPTRSILCSDCETSDECVCKDDILSWPWIELTCAHDMVLQLH